MRTDSDAHIEPQTLLICLVLKVVREGPLELYGYVVQCIYSMPCNSVITQITLKDVWLILYECLFKRYY